MWPLVRMTSDTIARRWGVIRRPLLRSRSSTSSYSVVATGMAAIVAACCRCNIRRLRDVELAARPLQRDHALIQLELPYVRRLRDRLARSVLEEEPGQQGGQRSRVGEQRPGV